MSILKLYLEQSGGEVAYEDNGGILEHDIFTTTFKDGNI
jgi:hypothetical protein